MFSFFKEMKPERRSLLIACFYAYFCSGLVALTQGSVMPDLKSAYGLTDTFSGILLSAHSIGNMAAGFLAGAAAVALGRKRSVVALSSLSFIGVALMALCGAPAVLFFAFVLTGVGRGTITNFNNGTVNAITDGDPAALNLLHCTFSLGAIAAPMLFLAVRGLVSWRAALAVIVLFGAVSVGNLIRLKMEDGVPRARQGGGSWDFSFMRAPAFVVLGLMMLFYLCSEFAINGWLVTYIQSKDSLLSALPGEGAVRAYSQSMATLLWVVILVGRLFCAWLSQRISARRLMLLCALGEGAAFAGMLFSNTIPAVTVCVALTGFCMAGIAPMIYADAAVYTNRYPMATGTLLSFGSVGGIVMPALVGGMAERFGFGGGMFAILAAICLLVICAAVNLALGSRNDR